MANPDNINADHVNEQAAVYMAQMKRQGDDEATIDLMNLFANLLVHWKPIAIAAILCAALAIAYGAYTRHMNEITPLFSEEDLDAAKEVLSPYELEEANTVYNQYLAYVKSMETLEEYNRQAVVLQMDPDSAVGYNAQYLLVTDIGNANIAFSKTILSKEDYQKIAELLNSDVKNIRSVVEIGTSITGQDTQVFDLERDEKLAGSISGEYKLLLTVSVLAPDESTAQKMVDIVEKAIERKASQLRDLDVKVDYSLVGGSWDEDATDRVVAMQQDNATAIGTILKTKNDYLKNTVSNLSAEQQSYIKLLRTRDEPENREKTVGLKKLAVIGFLAGALLLALWFVLRYLLGGVIHTGTELTDRFGIPVIGQLAAGEAKKQPLKIDIFKRWGLNLMDIDVDRSEDAAGLLAREIGSISEKCGIRKLCVLTDSDSAEAEKLISIIGEKTGDGLTVVKADIDMSTATLDKILDADSVLLVPVLDHTKMKQISRTISACDRNMKRIMGFAILRDNSLR